MGLFIARMTSYSEVSVSCQHAFGHCAEDADDIDQCIEDINLLQLIEVVLMVCERLSRFAIRQSSHTIDYRRRPKYRV